MKHRNVVAGLIALAAMTVTASAANAVSALLYRPAATGLWVSMATQNTVKPSGVFAGSAYKSFSSKAKASVATGCGVDLAVFSVEVNAPSPNTAIVLYEATSASLIDVAIEGNPSPLGGTYGSFKGVNPAVAINTVTCDAYVVFRANGVGAPAASDTGIVNVLYTVPALVGSPATVLVQEGNAAPAPFPVASTFAEFPASLSIPASYDGGATALAFRGQVTGGGVSSADDTGIFGYYVSGPLLATMAREGDPSCPPGWSGAGPVFDDFPATLTLGVNSGFGPLAAYRAKSRGGSSSSDTAIVQSFATCGTPSATAVEGTASPLFGNYGDFAATTPLAYSISGVVFLANVSGVPGIPKALFSGAVFTPASTVVPNSSALGVGSIVLPANPSPAINAASPPDILFSSRVAGFSPGTFLFNSTTASFPALVTIQGHNAQIDVNGNMTVRLP